MYVLVNKELSPSQRSVQSCHAVAEFIFRNSNDSQVKEWVENDKTLIILGLDNVNHLHEWENRLINLNIPIATFIEPDIGNQKTAIAIHPCADKSLFKKLKLI